MACIPTWLFVVLLQGAGMALLLTAFLLWLAIKLRVFDRP